MIFLRNKKKLVPNTNSAQLLGGPIYSACTHSFTHFRSLYLIWGPTDKITAHCQVRQQRREALRVCGREDCPATGSQTGVGSEAGQVDGHVQGGRPHFSSLWPLVQPDLALPHQAARLHAQAVSQSAFRQSLSSLLARAIHRVEQVISLRAWVIHFPRSSRPNHSFIHLSHSAFSAAIFPTPCSPSTISTFVCATRLRSYSRPIMTLPSSITWHLL